MNIVYQVCFRMIQDNQTEIKFNWTHQLLIYADNIIY
jgi:hypothetical protein